LKEIYEGDFCMRKVCLWILAVSLLVPCTSYALSVPTQESVSQGQDNERRVLTVPSTSGRKRRIRRDRRRSKSIGKAFSNAGKSAGRGGARFGKHTAKGGKELGKGMGQFGKHTGKGFARIGKRIGNTFKGDR
jgi:hypothetical protein